MKCPRCNSNSFVTFYEYDDPKCTSCGHTGYKVPAEVIQEYSDQLGKIGGGTHYIKKNPKKYHH